MKRCSYAQNNCLGEAGVELMNGVQISIKTTKSSINSQILISSNNISAFYSLTIKRAILLHLHHITKYFSISIFPAFKTPPSKCLPSNTPSSPSPLWLPAGKLISPQTCRPPSNRHSIAQAPSNCYQTATGSPGSVVGFCVCSTPVTTVVPSTLLAYTTVPITQTVTITTSSISSYTTVVPATTTEASSYILRGEECFPSSPYEPPSPYESPSY
jgi:hypothetical protein